MYLNVYIKMFLSICLMYCDAVHGLWVSLDLDSGFGESSNYNDVTAFLRNPLNGFR